MKRFFLSTAILAAFVLMPCLPTAGQAPAVTRKTAVKTRAQRYVELASNNETMKGSLFAVLAVKENGDTVVAWKNGQRMLPASNMKLVTTGAAMVQLGKDYRFKTRIGYSGEIVEGVLNGDLYIIGGGDPTIASKDSIATDINTLMGRWKGFLDNAGIKRINGRIIGDGRYFDGPIEKDSWAYQDLGTDYGVGGDGLCFYENQQEFKVSHGASVGSPVNISVSYPVTPWMKYSYNARTAKAGTGDQLYLFNSDVYPYAEVRGSFAIDRNPKTEYFSNKFGAYTCASYFRNYLIKAGIPVDGEVADIRTGRIRSNLQSLEYGSYAAKVDDLNIIGTTRSATLKEIVREANCRSDNFYAETFLRMLGRQMHHSASYDSSYVALDDVLRKLGVDASDVKFDDGSGLSRHNYLTPDFLVRFLSRMMDDDVFEDYVETLPQPGSNGTLSSVLRNEDASLKERIYAKSGSMDGVLCYSGYIVPGKGAKDDVIVFSIMTNNALAKTSTIRATLERVMVMLAAENQ